MILDEVLPFLTTINCQDVDIIMSVIGNAAFVHYCCKICRPHCIFNNYKFVVGHIPKISSCVSLLWCLPCHMLVGLGDFRVFCQTETFEKNRKDKSVLGCRKLVESGEGESVSPRSYEDPHFACLLGKHALETYFESPVENCNFCMVREGRKQHVYSLLLMNEFLVSSSIWTNGSLVPSPKLNLTFLPSCSYLQAHAERQEVRLDCESAGDQGDADADPPHGRPGHDPGSGLFAILHFFSGRRRVGSADINCF